MVDLLCARFEKGVIKIAKCNYMVRKWMSGGSFIIANI